MLIKSLIQCVKCVSTKQSTSEGSTECAHSDFIWISFPISGGKTPFRPRFAKFLHNCILKFRGPYQNGHDWLETATE